MVFEAKKALLRVRRAVQNVADELPKLPKGPSLPFVLTEVRSSLHRESAGTLERSLELGKVQNLRIVVGCLDGCSAQAGQTFSFWRHVGRCTSRRGFRNGRQLQEGCLLPAVGGGICQFTNALYEAALKAGLEIVERHPHTAAIPGSAAEKGTDATVAWNHIDLRLRSDRPWQISAKLTATELIVQVRSESPKAASVEFGSRPKRPMLDTREHSCASCGALDCHVKDRLPSSVFETTAIVVDEVWPEFDAYLATLTGRCELLVPLDGERFHRPNYRWSHTGFEKVHVATRVALLRSFRQRRLGNQGAARQRALLKGTEQLANAYIKRLPAEATHLVIAQSLLPYLWRKGVLGGRTFDVLMSRLPVQILQDRLDRSLSSHPERTLLGDFRAEPWLVQAEQEALTAARRVITPHRFVAESLPNSVLIPWARPKHVEWTLGDAIAFPGPTAGRKGAYEVRAAATSLKLEVFLNGSNVEGEDFWEGVKIRRANPEDWLKGVAVVVQPAILEDRPRQLLEALAAGCPVIATTACGLPDHPNLTIVPDGDIDALIEAVRKTLGSPAPKFLAL